MDILATYIDLQAEPSHTNALSPCSHAEPSQTQGWPCSHAEPSQTDTTPEPIDTAADALGASSLPLESYATSL